MTDGSVTVVIPTRDRRDVLPATLGPVLAQRGVDLRVVVVDDASSDGTGDWVRSLQDERVSVLRHEDATGAATSRNDGARSAATRWVAFCDDDDLWAPDKLERQLAALRAHAGARWAATGAVHIDDDRRVLEVNQPVGGDVLARILSRNQVVASSVMVETSLFVEVGGFRNDLLSSEDWDLWVRLAQRSPLAVAPEPLVAVRVWAGSKSRKTERMERAFDTIQATYEPVAKELGVSPDRQGHQRYLAKQELRAGRRFAAARRFARLGARYRDPASFLRAAGALGAPELLDRIGTDRARRELPADVVASAERWLLAVDRPELGV
jgi:GT2 family glycosyltransferase